MRLTDYRVIGFDMDNTLIRYRLHELLCMEYRVLANYVVKVKGYNYPSLLQPLGYFEQDFMQKGLVLDIAKGNFLKLSPDGVILAASHGTRKISDNEIAEVYGKSHRSSQTEALCKSLIENCAGEVCAESQKPIIRKKFRLFKDYFDLPAALLCAKIVDCLDSDSQRCVSTKYKFWMDVLCGLVDMFQREHFHSDEGGFYPELKQFPEKYLWPCSPELKQWLKDTSENHITFLISGSEAEYVDHIARYCLGTDWQQHFKFIVCSARKPSFFSASNTRPFRVYNENKSDAGKTSELSPDAILQPHVVYVHGNWSQLYKSLSHYHCEHKNVVEPNQKEWGKCQDKNLRCVYIGDNLIQDVLAPRQMNCCDTIAVVEELAAEGWKDINEAVDRHIDRTYLESKFWGSFFYVDSALCSDTTVTGPSRMNTLWGSIFRSYSRLCVPFITSLVRNSHSHEYLAFGDECDGGFYPANPTVLD